MSSPGVVIGNSESPLNLKFIGVKQKKKQVSSDERVILLEPVTDYTNDSDRFSQLADIFIEQLIRNNVKMVWMEGYAYGATGNTFSIGECTGILKYKLFLANIDVNILQPGEIKKFATGKGNANKTLMYKAYMSKSNHDLCSILDTHVKGDKIPSPISDLIDAYYILQLGLNELPLGT